MALPYQIATLLHCILCHGYLPLNLWFAFGRDVNDSAKTGKLVNALYYFSPKFPTQMDCRQSSKLLRDRMTAFLQLICRPSMSASLAKQVSAGM